MPNLTVDGDLLVTGDSTTQGDALIVGSEVVGGGLTVRENLFVGQFSRLSAAAVVGLCKATGDVDSDQQLVAASGFVTPGDCTVGTNLVVQGVTNLGGATTVAGSFVCTGTGTHGALEVEGSCSIEGDLTCGGTVTTPALTGLSDPTAANDAAPKSYVDALVQRGRVLQQQAILIATGYDNVDSSQTIPVHSRPLIGSGTAGPVLSFTPTASDSLLEVDFVGYGTTGGGSDWFTVTLNDAVRDPVNSIMVNSTFTTDATAAAAVTLSWSGVSGTTNPQQFVLRFGHNAPGVRSSHLCKTNPAETQIFPGANQGFFRVTEYSATT